jgi:hypothetical protein
MNPLHYFRYLLLLILAGIFVSGETHAQSRESMVKAGFIEKFTHFIQWPESKTGIESGNKIVIAIIGEDMIGTSLTKFFQNSEKGSKEFEIVNVEKLEQVKDCKILFISGTEKTNIDKIITYTTGKPILTIGDTKGFGEKGVIINMFKEGDFIRYEINKKSLSKSGLQINSMLLNYAVIIE